MVFIGNPNLDEINLNYKLNGNMYSLTYKETLPIFSRLYKHPNCIFPIQIEPQDTVTALLEIRHKSINVYTEIKILTENQFMYKDKLTSLLYGGYFGFELVVLMLIPFLIIYGTPTKFALSYFLYHFFILVIVADSTGHLFSYIIPNLSGYEKQITRFLTASIFLLLINLTKKLLEDSKLYLTDYILIVLFGFIVIMLLSFKQLPVSMLDGLTYFLVLYTIISIVWILYLLWSNYIRRSNLVLIFSIGISPLIFSSVLRIFANLMLIENEHLLRIANYSLSGSVLFESIVFFGLFIYINVEKKNKLNASKLKEKELIIANQNALLNERIRISSDIHDDIGSGLLLIKYLCQKLKRRNNNEYHQSEILEISDRSDQLIENLKEMIWTLDADQNTLEDLIIHLRQQVSSYLSAFDIELNIKVNEQIPKTVVSYDFRRNVQLVIKEVIQNIVKHSIASSVDMIIEGKESLILSIKDNGIGFNPQRIKKGKGLENINSRVAKLNGQLKTASGNGVFYNISIPIDRV